VRWVGARPSQTRRNRWVDRFGNDDGNDGNDWKYGRNIEFGNHRELDLGNDWELDLGNGGRTDRDG
jgi:hypothetical protein